MSFNNWNRFVSETLEQLKHETALIRSETGGQSMTEQARELRRAYKREWNRKNKDKVKAAQERYWDRKAQAAQDQDTDEPNQQEA